MANKSRFNDAQWLWLNQKRQEGYTLTQLSRIAGISRSAIVGRTESPTGERRVNPERLPMIGLRAEFLSLKETHESRYHY